MVNVLSAARRLVQDGCSVLPIKCDGSKQPWCEAMPEGRWGYLQQQRPNDADLVHWFGNGRRLGLALIGGAVSGNVEQIDFDTIELLEPFRTLVESAAPGLVARLVQIGTPRPGYRLVYRCDDPVPGNLVLARRLMPADDNYAAPRVRATIETRGEGGYALVPGGDPAAHATGRPYVLEQGDLTAMPIITAAERQILLNAARALTEYLEPERQVRQCPAPRERASGSGLLPGDDFNARADPWPILEQHGWQDVGSTRNEGRLLRRPGKMRGWSATLGAVAPGVLMVFSTSAAPFATEHGYDAFSIYTLLEHDGDYPAAARALRSQGYGTAMVPEFAPTPVASVAAPNTDPDEGAPVDDDGRPKVLEHEALYGLPGETVKTVLPHTESHPAAVLASFLTGTGCLIGPQPHVYRDGARLTCNEFGILVGPTAAGRKGSASRRTDEVYRKLYDSNETEFRLRAGEGSGFTAPDYASLIISGLGSGEALIETLADENADRRRMVFEEEFSRALKVMGRDGSILSETLRQAFDGSPLSNRTKGKQLVARDAHISVLGHITERELQQQLGMTEMFNGFANRFLWVWTQRQKFLPLGGGHPPLAPVVSKLYHALERAGQMGAVEFDDEVQQLWCPKEGLYEQLTTRPENLFGAVTNRAEAHITRLALQWAVLDVEQDIRHPLIRLPHLMAALAFWDYSERTCLYLFGSLLGDDAADRIEELLWSHHPGYATRKDIRDAFSRHARGARIEAALSLLHRQGRAVRGQVPGDGRYSEVWIYVPAEERNRTRAGYVSPLVWARKQIGSDV